MLYMCVLGMTATEAIGVWKRQAERVLGLRCSGDFESEVYKVVAQREVSHYNFLLFSLRY